MEIHSSHRAYTSVLLGLSQHLVRLTIMLIQSVDQDAHAVIPQLDVAIV